MQRNDWKSGLVWLTLATALCGTVATARRVQSDPNTIAPPGHEAGACGACGAHQSARGPALPYELGDDNVRFIPPDHAPVGPPSSHSG